LQTLFRLYAASIVNLCLVRTNNSTRPIELARPDTFRFYKLRDTKQTANPSRNRMEWWLFIFTRY